MAQTDNRSDFAERIEPGLSSTLFRYVVPFIDKKIKEPQKKQKSRGLEDILNNQKFGLKDIKELEMLLLENLSKNTKINEKTGTSSNDFFHSLTFRRQKNKDEKSDKYSVSIRYEESQHGDKLKISVKKAEKEVYSAEITNKKETESRITPYKVIIAYEENYAEERLAITYRQQLRGYMREHLNSKEDMTNRVPLKWLNILPETMMGGVLGFTYIGDHSMGRRADLTGSTARMVDIHESIHTPDEYETRILTSWIMEKTKPKYVK